MNVRYEGVGLRAGRETVLASLHFEVPAGSIGCFYGPTRSGKTALLLMTGGMLKPTSGEIWLGNTRVRREPLQARRLTGLGVVPEFNPLLETLSVQENLLFQCRVYGVQNAERRVSTLMEQLDLVAVARRRAEDLPQPELLRAGLAMALVHDPAVLLVDEPSHALTTHELAEGWRYIEQLKAQGKTILVSSHSAWVARHADIALHLPQCKEVRHHELSAVGMA